MGCIVVLKGYIVVLKLNKVQGVHCVHARSRRWSLKFETVKQPLQIKEFSYWFSTNLNQPMNKQVKIKATSCF